MKTVELSDRESRLWDEGGPVYHRQIRARMTRIATYVACDVEFFHVDGRPLGIAQPDRSVS